MIWGMKGRWWKETNQFFSIALPNVSCIIHSQFLSYIDLYTLYVYILLVFAGNSDDIELASLLCTDLIRFVFVRFCAYLLFLETDMYIFLDWPVTWSCKYGANGGSSSVTGLDAGTLIAHDDIMEHWAGWAVTHGEGWCEVTNDVKQNGDF